MKAFLVLLLLSAVALWPFIALRQRWALRLWQRFKVVIIVYVLVIFVSAVVALVFRWDGIYG